MPWYTHFFTGLPQEAWKAAQTDEQTQLELERIVESLEFGPDDRVLDVFCGYGRHALPLAKMGADVVGIDISDESIAELNASVGRKKLALTAVAGDFMAIDTAALGAPASFQAAYCLGNSLSFFPRVEMLAFLQRIADLLEPGGRFLAQSGMVAESFLPDFQERAWLPVGDAIQVLIENQYDPLTARVDQHLTYYRRGKTGVEVVERTAEYYIYTLADLLRLFNEANLEPIACYGTVEGDSYQVGDEGVWVLAVKKPS
ncbi:class I SAM-dependent methyltransferase [uncultured Fibrella sp.]|uniref:class I SAM-dependent methyltransferase n=1 Tax=uncultured Fibrella sp. TaxID=1284596 RepID=UPI0035CA2E4A